MHNNDTPLATDSCWLPVEYSPGLFSVIVPTYNRAHTIVESLDSVWTQTYRPIEIIIVDDGSTDNTLDVVRMWSEKHPDSSLFHCNYEFQANAGVCSARNRALKKSTGEYIQFLDSDDTLYPERFQRLADVFENHGCDYIETGFEGFLSETREVVEVHRGHTISNQLDLLLEGKLWPNTLRPAYTRKLVNRIGRWNVDMVTLQDYEYVIRALTLNPQPKCAAIGDVLASARRDSCGRMSDIIQTKQGRVLRVHCEELLCDAVRGRVDIPDMGKLQLSSRLYALGMRCNGSGWVDLGRKCALLADSIGVKLDSRGRRRRLACRCGRVGSKVYRFAASLKFYYLSVCKDLKVGN